MPRVRLITLERLVVLAALLGGGPAGLAQPAYPGKPIHLVVPYAPGGAVDALARPVAPLARSGKLRALAVIEDKRARIAPELPTLRETLPAYHVPDLWFGFLASAGVKPE